MAIEKIRTRKYEFTTPTIVQLGVSAVLVIISLLLGYSAFRRWQLKSSLLEAYAFNDSNQSQRALKSLDSALSWESDHVGARQLRAKLLCDSGKLDQAEADYKRLIAQGYNKVQVRCGLGVIALKRADKAKPGAVAGFVSQARSEFDSAGSAPEAEIGLGHCDLMLAAKSKDAGRLSAAGAKFRSIKTKMDNDLPYRRRTTRDGLVDYYAGLGRALGSSGEFNKDASNAFRACYQYAPTWPVPMVNMLGTESIRLSQVQMTDKALAKERPDLERFRAKMNVAWRGNAELYSGVKDAWLQFTMAMAKANADAGNLLVFGQLMYEIQHSRDFSDRYEPLIFQATQPLQ